MKAPQPRTGRTLALCADDFGLSPGISAGIASLAWAQRLNAVSCITNSRHWESDAPLLRRLPPSVDVGLHINLTEGQPLSPQLARVWPQLPALSVLIARAHLGLLPGAEIRCEIDAQLAAFQSAMGRAPTYVDGHQHVHHLPVLRTIVLDLVDQLHPRPAVRATARVVGPGFGVKRWLIRHTGGRALARELRRRALAHNPVLLGVYDFQQPDYRALVLGWLAALPAEGGLLFCHPGETAAHEPADAIGAARQRELDYLGSDLFPQDLATAGVRLGNVWHTGEQPPR